MGDFPRRKRQSFLIARLAQKSTSIFHVENIIIRLLRKKKKSDRFIIICRYLSFFFFFRVSDSAGSFQRTSVNEEWGENRASV